MTPKIAVRIRAWAPIIPSTLRGSERSGSFVAHPGRAAESLGWQPVRIRPNIKYTRLVFSAFPQPFSEQRGMGILRTQPKSTSPSDFLSESPFPIFRGSKNQGYFARVMGSQHTTAVKPGASWQRAKSEEPGESRGSGSTPDDARFVLSPRIFKPNQEPKGGHLTS